jgi:hypothetical protein
MGIGVVAEDPVPVGVDATGEVLDPDDEPITLD